MNIPFFFRLSFQLFVASHNLHGIMSQELSLRSTVASKLVLATLPLRYCLSSFVLQYWVRCYHRHTDKNTHQSLPLRRYPDGALCQHIVCNYHDTQNDDTLTSASEMPVRSLGPYSEPSNLERYGTCCGFCCRLVLRRLGLAILYPDSSKRL